MSEFQLLLIEDDDSYIEQCESYLEFYNEKHGRSIGMSVAKSIEEAKQLADRSIDVAVVDLDLGGGTSDGGDVIDEVKAHFRIPVAILTGTPADAEDEAPVIGVFTKGEHGFGDVLDRLWQVHEIGLTKIMGGRGLIEKSLNAVFLKNLVPTIDSWITYGQRDSDRTEKALLRYALGYLVADLEGDEVPCFPEEFYLDPPLENSLTTGSLLQRNSDSACFTVMTPACDLVFRSNGRRKANSVVAAHIVPETELHEILNANSGRRRRLRVNNDSSCYHWMPRCSALDNGYIDFQNLVTVELASLEQEYTQFSLRIAPSFVKDIVARFSSFYARQGQPSIDDGTTT